jgi:uncharacterized membrane protein
MKTANTNLTNEQAIKQLKQFSIIGLACAVVGLVMFWWLGIAGAAFGTRSLVLATHKANKGGKDTKKYQAFGAIAFVIGLADIILANLG